MPQTSPPNRPQPQPQQQKPAQPQQSQQQRSAAQQQPQGAPPQSQPKAAPPPAPKDEANKKADENKQAAPHSTREHDAARDNPAPMKMPVAGVAPPEPGLALGARPHDKRDPQSAKFEVHAAPPFWNAPDHEAEPKAREEWAPDPALDAREQKPPPGYYADGMSAPDEQRARAAWVEAHGVKEYDEATDQRPPEDRPVFDPHALTGGAFVKAGKQRQVPGVVPPTKRE